MLLQIIRFCAVIFPSERSASLFSIKLLVRSSVQSSLNSRRQNCSLCAARQRKTNTPLSESWIYVTLIGSENHQLASNTGVSAAVLRTSHVFFYFFISEQLELSHMLNVRTLRRGVIDRASIAQQFSRRGEARLHTGIKMLNSHSEKKNVRAPWLDRFCTTAGKRAEQTLCFAIKGPVRTI